MHYSITFQRFRPFKVLRTNSKHKQNFLPSGCPPISSYRTQHSKIHQKSVLQHFHVKFCGEQDSYVYFNSTKFQLQIQGINRETKFETLVPCFTNLSQTFSQTPSMPLHKIR